MKFLLDENFPRAAVQLLVSLGHQVDDIRDLSMAGSDDTQVVTTARNRGAIILTTDRDFFHTLHHTHPGHPGVVVVALRQPSRQAILSRLEWLCRNISSSHFAGRAFQLRDETWIAQPPLEDCGNE